MSVEVSPRPQGRGLEVAAWLALAALLVVAVPLYLAMPLTVDVYFYDASGQVVLRGGALEKEVLFLSATRHGLVTRSGAVAPGRQPPRHPRR